MSRRGRTAQSEPEPEYYLEEDVDEPDDNGASELSTVARIQLIATTGKWKQ